MASVILAYTEEVAGLKADLGHRIEDIVKAGLEKADLDRKAAEIKEELMNSNSTLRESENTIKQQEIDATRITNELERSAKQLDQKEADLRSTMASLTEERQAIRSDMGALQSRITLLEQERVETASLLAGKREECLSVSRELAQQKESMITLQSKVRINAFFVVAHTHPPTLIFISLLQ